MDAPLDNPRWERYCRERAAGRSQRQALLSAYPQRASWKPDTLDSHACRLEADGRVKARLSALQAEAAKAAVISRADVLNGMAETFAKAREANAERITQVGVQAISSIGRTLLEAIPPERGDDAGAPFTADYGLLLAGVHLPMHRRVAEDVGADAWMPGGRMSGKSSAISLEIAGGMMAHPDRSAVCFLKIGRYIREGVYEQMLWALGKLGVEDEWECTVSPPRMVRRSTGQAIVFRGCDRAGKTKAIKAPAGTYFAYQWFEEVDQFSGMAEIRSLRQSLTRGPEGAPFFRFYSYNPPRSKSSWTFAEESRREAAGEAVWRSTYLDMPPEWIPQAARDDAEALRGRDEESYRHEYLGEPVGFGAEVFPRAEVRPVPDEERRRIEVFRYGVDWGFAADPFCFLKVGYIHDTRTLYILDEYSCHGRTNAETAEVVAEMMGQARMGADGQPVEDAEPFADVMCDSAEPKSIEDFRQAGIRAIPAPKQGANGVRNSIRWLQDRAAIVIDPSCPLAASEFATYQYELTPDGEVTGRLPDACNHAVDAARYACATLILDRRMV